MSTLETFVIELNNGDKPLLFASDLREAEKLAKEHVDFLNENRLANGYQKLLRIKSVRKDKLS